MRATAADQVGPQPDPGPVALSPSRTGTVGVIVTDLGNPFIAPVVRGAENELSGRGMMVFVTETQDSNERLEAICNHLVTRRVDALIVTAARDGNHAILEKTAQQLPIVLAVRGPDDSELPAVLHDDAEGGRLALEHLADLGHRSVAQLHGPPDMSSFRRRAIGFRTAAGAVGIEVVDVDDAVRLPTVGEGWRSMTRLLTERRDDRPTAVFAHNDTMALGAIAAMREAGLRCPEDIAVIGYNDSPLTAYTAPPLTTIRLPAYELGRLAAGLAVSLFEGHGEEGGPAPLLPKLVVRGSTAPPPHG